MSDIETMIKALRILSQEIQSGDGVANACVADAADMIERLAEQVNNAKAGEWISVDDRLPRVGERVLIYSRQILEAIRYEGSKFNRFGLSVEGATHWMPLPEIPEVK